MVIYYTIKPVFSSSYQKEKKNQIKYIAKKNFDCNQKISISYYFYTLHVFYLQ